MPPSFSYGFLLLAGLCFLHAGSQTTDFYDIHNFVDHPPCWEVAITLTNVSFTLLGKAAQKSSHTNILFAPISMAAAITILSLGTKGDTHKEIMEGLRLNLVNLSEAEIHKCFRKYLFKLQQPNKRSPMMGGISLFLDQNLNVVDKFVQDFRNLYHDKAIFINFTDTMKAKRQINNHISQKTLGENVVFKDLENDTDLALVTFMSAHGKWYDYWQCQRVVKEKFHVNETTTIMIPTVNSLGIYNLGRYEYLFSWVLVETCVGNLRIFLIMPDKGKMQQVEQMLTQKHIIRMEGTFNKRGMKLHVPEIFVSGFYDLESILSHLGITQVFGSNADLSGITGGAPLKRSKFTHKAVFTFDDKGTGASGNPLPNPADGTWARVPTFKFNRPFLIFVKDEITDAPLLVGRVINPQAWGTQSLSPQDHGCP